MMNRIDIAGAAANTNAEPLARVDVLVAAGGAVRFSTTRLEVEVVETSSGFEAQGFLVAKGARSCARSFEARSFKTFAGVERAARRWLTA